MAAAELYKLDKLFIPVTAMAAELWFQFQGDGGGANSDCKGKAKYLIEVIFDPVLAVFKF